MVPVDPGLQLSRRSLQDREADDIETTLLVESNEVEEEEEEESVHVATPFANDSHDNNGAVPTDDNGKITSEQMVKRQTITIIELGIGLCLVFSAGITQGFIIQPVLSSIHEEDPRISEYAGYHSLTIFLISYTVFNLFAAPFVTFFGPKWSLVFSSAGNAVHMLGFLHINPYFLIFSSALQGVCSAVVGTAVGVLLAQNSTEKTISRNSGIMWMIFMISMVIGGVFLLVMFSSNQDQKISVELIRHIHIGFACFCVSGGVAFAFMRISPSSNTEETSTWNEMKKSIRLMFTLDMSLLFPLFIFVGLEAGIYTGVYSTALAYTTAFHMNTFVLIAWNSIAVGTGQITAAMSLAIFGERTSRFGVFPLVLISSLAGCFAFSLALINIPGNAAYEQTDGIAFINPSVPIALISGFLMGVCDCFGNTAIFSFISVRYEQEAAQANSVMKFVSALPMIVAVYLGSMLKLHWHLWITSIAAILACLSFVVAERRSKEFKKVRL